MSTEPLTQLRLTRLANLVLDAGADALTDRAHVEVATALYRAASFVLAVKGIADDALDRPAAGTRRSLQEACRDFELGEQFAKPAAPATLSLEPPEVRP